VGELGGEHTPAALMLPFLKQVLYASPRFAALKQSVTAYHERAPDPNLIGVGSFEDLMALQAYTVILDRLYGMPMRLDAAMVMTVVDPADGREKQFRLDMDFRFCRIDVCPSCTGLPEMGEADRARIMERLGDIDVLTRLLPPSAFSFEGFVVIRLVEVSREHTVAELKEALTAVDTLTEVSKLARVQEGVRRMLGKEDCEIVLVAVQDQQVLQLHSNSDECDFEGFKRSSLDEFHGSLFLEAHQSGAARVISDLATAPGDSAAERAMRQGGIRSVLYVPLVLNGEKVGGLLLQSGRVGGFSPIDVINLGEVLQSFAIALARGMANFEARVKAIIQEQYTAIHPAVEWKFRRAAVDRLMAGDECAGADSQKIDFENVWPLYSVSDIRSSSHFRNEAIRADLLRQLGLAGAAVAAARAARPLPYLDELDYRLGQHAGRLADGLSSGDEIELLNFLTHEVEPAMAGLDGFGPATDAACAAYRAAIHPEHRSVYDKRRDFDESVTRINRTISAFVDRLQPEAQAMFPHYFDKNSTDGVDMNMYIGPSLVPDGSWKPMYLKNLRLWQFIIMCRIAHLAWKLRDQLPLPLQTTHLLVVQDMPISILFNQDEKRFAVDGAYNIRYEIMKKRIDKAVVKGSGERLTQPDRIAIVYSQHSEAAEYERYVRYL
jgi:GAF domain-containing protein